MAGRWCGCLEGCTQRSCGCSTVPWDWVPSCPVLPQNDGRLRLSRQGVIFKNSKTGKVDNIQASELAEGVWRRVALGHGLKLLTKNGHVYKYDGFRESVSPCSCSCHLSPAPDPAVLPASPRTALLPASPCPGAVSHLGLWALVVPDGVPSLLPNPGI